MGLNLEVRGRAVQREDLTSGHSDLRTWRSFFTTGFRFALIGSSCLSSTLVRDFDYDSYWVGWMQLRTLERCFRNNLSLVLCPRPTMEALRLANSAFAVDLYKQLCEKEPADNVLFSPICLSTSLSLAQVGAKGDTADEIGQVRPTACLCFEWKRVIMHRWYLGKGSEVLWSDLLRVEYFAISSTLSICFLNVKAHLSGLQPTFRTGTMSWGEPGD